MPSKQLHSEVLAGDSETAKHHGPEGRNDLQKHAVPGLDVPSGFSKKQSEFSCWACCCCCRYRCCCCCRLPQRTPCHTETPCYWRTEQPPKTCCPEAWRPFWILLDSAIAAAGPAAAAAPAAAAGGLLELVLNLAFWTDKKLAPKCSSHAFKTAPQRSSSGRFRNSKTPWPWRTERPPKTCCPGAWRPFWILIKTKNKASL